MLIFLIFFFQDEDIDDEQFEWLLVENNTQPMLKQTFEKKLVIHDRKEVEGDGVDRMIVGLIE